MLFLYSDPGSIHRICDRCSGMIRAWLVAKLIDYHPLNKTFCPRTNSTRWFRPISQNQRHHCNAIKKLLKSIGIEIYISTAACGLWWNYYFHPDLTGSHKKSQIFPLKSPGLACLGVGLRWAQQIQSNKFSPSSLWRHFIMADLKKCWCRHFPPLDLSLELVSEQADKPLLDTLNVSITCMLSITICMAW